MKIFIILSIIILLISLIVKNILSTAKRNLFKDQSAWSGKDIKIKYVKSNKVKDPKRNENYLTMIAEESKIYLDDQSKEEKHENN